jgi:tRNA nucleotidyltransferase/poly(A) polymerase
MRFSQFLREDALELALPTDVRSAIIDKGGKIYQVGGAVRDEMLGKVSKDLDLLVVGIELKDLATLLTRFGKTNLVGKAFGIIKFVPTGATEEIDISVPRIDSKSTGKGHKDFEVKLGKGITLQQDQLRRDFWMNAMARDVETGEIHDIDKKGQTDIKNKQIRVIGIRAFREDPLRMLRAVQFAARFEFTIEPKTMDQIKSSVNLIKTVSPERFQEEFKKMFEKGTPSVGVALLKETGILKKLFPKARDAFPMEYDRLDKKGFPAFLAVLLKGHKSKDIQSAMKLSNEDTNAISDVLKYMAMRDVDSDLGLIRFVNSASKKGVENVNYILKAQRKIDIDYRLNSLRRVGKPTSLKELGLSGRDLIKMGIRGRAVGETLDKLLQYAVETGKNDRKDLIAVVKGQNA